MTPTLFINKQRNIKRAATVELVTALKIISLSLCIQLTKGVNDIQLAAKPLIPLIPFTIKTEVQRFQRLGHVADVAVGAGFGAGQIS